MKISIIAPVYAADDCIDELYLRLSTVLKSITPDYEIILVDDHSQDSSWDKIKSISSRDKKVRGLHFSRNFGQHFAITAGLDSCSGEWVVVMDCDLQDKPEEIPKLYEKACEGYDIVFAQRIARKDNYLKRIFSKAFYIIFDFLTDQKSDPSIANFGIYNKQVVTNFCKMREGARAFPLFVRWLGFNSTSIAVEHAKRHSGDSSYSFRKSLELAINAILSHSNKPLRLSIELGFTMALGSLLAAAFFISRYYLYSVSVAGWTSVIVSIYFLAGLFFINAGFIGLYIGRIYQETKNRPLYVISETTNIEDN